MNRWIVFASILLCQVAQGVFADPLQPELVRTYSRDDLGIGIDEDFGGRAFHVSGGGFASDGTLILAVWGFTDGTLLYFDQNLDLRERVEHEQILSSSRFIVSNNEDLYGYSPQGSGGVVGIAKNGECSFRFYPEEIRQIGNAFAPNSAVITDYGVFGWMRSQSMFFVPKKNLAAGQSSSSIYVGEQIHGYLLDNDVDASDVQILDHRFLVVDGQLRTRMYSDYYDYWSSRLGDFRAFAGHVVKPFARNSASLLSWIGTDADGRTYWLFRTGNMLQINDRDGTTLGLFQYSSPSQVFRPIVHPNGTVYFVESTDTEVALFALPRRW